VAAPLANKIKQEVPLHFGPSGSGDGLLRFTQPVTRDKGAGAGLDFGDPAKAGEKASRIASGMAPKPFYAKAAIDRMVFQRMIDFFSPGSSARMQEHVQSQYHSGYWWPPSTSDAVYPPQELKYRTAVGDRQ